MDIKVLNKLAQIKVEFVSNQKEKIADKEKNELGVKDIWTFEKNMSDNSVIWKLTEVGSE